MNKITLKWIIGLMSVSVVGLILFQYLWISTVIKTNDERFKKDVIEALNNVASKLERQEVLLFAYDNFSTNFKWKSPPMTISSDGPIEMFETTFEKKTLTKDQFVIMDSGDVGFNYDYSFYVDRDNGLDIEADPNVEVIIDGESSSHIIKIERKLDSLKLANERLKNDFEKVTRKSEMVQLVIHELMTKDRSLDSRFDERQLDSLLQAELLNKGIDIGYQYAVLDNESEELLFMTVSREVDEVNHYDLYKSDLKASLFPNDIIGESAFLAINFPDKSSYLIKKVWSTLLSSGVLSLIIIFCFAYSIHTIVKQKRLSEIKNDFINNMTHEFKTPIATVSLACEALQDNEIVSTESMRGRYLGIIRDENKRLAGQVEKVLQMAILEKNKPKLKLENLDIHQVIDNAIEKIQIQVDKKGGTIKKLFSANKTELLADQVHMTNIVSNLLDNANKYSRENPRISISTTNNNLGVYVKVADKGIGMSKEAIRNIFNKFYRVPTGNLHDVKGFGLGLAYVKNMVEAHGGTISVASEPKKGSEFTIFLPFRNE